jgi:hypothetical protein
MILVIVTCGARESPYLGNLVEQINQGGWQGIRMIVSDGPPSLATGWPTFATPQLEGQTKTYWRALATGLEAAKQSGSDRIVIFEDDVELSRNALQYMERAPLPEGLDFVTWFDGHAVPPGARHSIHVVPGDKFFCLQGVTWKLSTAERLLQSSAFGAWRERHAGDMLIAQILTGRFYGVHVPNLVQHMGAASICNPGQHLVGVRTANNYRGRAFDAMTLVSSIPVSGAWGAPEPALPPIWTTFGKAKGTASQWMLYQTNRPWRRRR